jgi:hypothetical protein
MDLLDVFISDVERLGFKYEVSPPDTIIIEYKRALKWQLTLYKSTVAIFIESVDYAFEGGNIFMSSYATNEYAPKITCIKSCTFRLVELTTGVIDSLRTFDKICREYNANAYNIELEYMRWPK